MSVTELLNQSNPLFLLIFFVLAALLIVLGAVLFCYLQRSLRRRMLRRRFSKGEQAEAKGLSLLKRAGYTLLSVQENLKARCLVDGNVIDYSLRPDAIVSKGRKRYLAEIKSGEVAPNPLFKETRRQLLEYFFFFKAEGILLVDMKEQTIHKVVFCGRRSQRKNGGRWFASGVLMGIVVSLFVFFTI